jgi:hypothetical protein
MPRLQLTWDLHHLVGIRVTVGIGPARPTGPVTVAVAPAYGSERDLGSEAKHSGGWHWHRDMVTA